MGSWQLQEAKAKLSEVIELAEIQGAQVITRRGIETAVLIPIAEWKRLQSAGKPTLLEILQSGPKGELPIPSRSSWKIREPVEL
jgi:prevent-host-death family protein